MPPSRVNEKKQAGRERKAEQKAKQEAEAARLREEQEAKEWQKGSNVRRAARADAQASKADDAARKRREKAELLAAEEAEITSSSKPKKTPALSKGKKKKKNDLSLLEDALVSAADKKHKAKKEKERLKKEKEAAATKVSATKVEIEEPLDPLLANTQQMIGSVSVNEDEMVGRHANKAADTGESGIDAALGSLNVGSAPDAHPEKRAKALHRAFEEKMMPLVKEEYPGLRLSQYKEKIFQMWKKSPENPINQQLQSPS